MTNLAFDSGVFRHTENQMSDLMSQATRARFGAAIVAIAPAVMLVGPFAHPYIANLPDEVAVAEA